LYQTAEAIGTGADGFVCFVFVVLNSLLFC